ncbi:MAG TPA: ParA family protein, partial [Kiloniellaceae bacterium]|nr:ParA family protein [Kiloniellaceae bacterium]
MKTVLVASSKGGVGKTTIATHLAAESALAGRKTVLVDADPQGSSTRWAERRASMESAVLPIDGSARHRSAWRSIPQGTERVVVDAPAGASADALEVYLEHADALVVPVLPSALDIDATVPFLNTLARHPRIRKGDLRVGLVGNRLRPWTNAS